MAPTPHGEWLTETRKKRAKSRPDLAPKNKGFEKPRGSRFLELEVEDLDEILIHVEQHNITTVKGRNSRDVVINDKSSLTDTKGVNLHVHGEEGISNINKTKGGSIKLHKKLVTKSVQMGPTMSKNGSKKVSVVAITQDKKKTKEAGSPISGKKVTGPFGALFERGSCSKEKLDGSLIQRTSKKTKHSCQGEALRETAGGVKKIVGSSRSQLKKQ